MPIAADPVPAFAGDSSAAKAAPAANNFGFSQSISSLVGASGSGIVIVDSDGKLIYSNTSANDANLQAGLTALTAQTNPEDYAVLIGSPLTMSPATASLVASISPSQAKSVTYIGDSVDSLSASSQPDPAAATVTLPSQLALGTATVFRNITLAGASTIFASGNNLAVRGGTNLTGTVSLYGGSDSASVPSSSVYISSTGAGNLTVYGGGNSGSVSGNTKVTVADTSPNASLTVFGGGRTGSVTGTTNVSFTSANPGAFSVYGGSGGGSGSNSSVGASVVNVLGTGGGTLTVSGSSPVGTVSGSIDLSVAAISSDTTVSTVYGDANPTPPALSTGRKITLSVDSPSYSFTNPIAATAYSLATSKGLLASTELDINAKNVPSISAGASGPDGFTNATTGANSNTAVIDIGSAAASKDNSGKVSSDLVHNFTSLNILPNNELDLSQTGYIFNGGTGVTGTSAHSSYQKNYSTFGAVNLWENSGISDKSLGGGTLGADNRLTVGPATPLIQAGPWNVGPNTFLKTYMFDGQAADTGGYNPITAPFPIIVSGFNRLSRDQSGTAFTSQSTLTWQPVASVAYGYANQPPLTGVYWGNNNSVQYNQPLMMVVPPSGAQSPTISPDEINGFDSSTSYGLISDYKSTTLDNSSLTGTEIFLTPGSIREFQFNGSNITDGSGVWSINSSLPGVSNQGSIKTDGTMTAYASYFDNTVNGTSFHNLASIIYPVSYESGLKDINPASFTTQSSSNKTNFITHVDVHTPALLGANSYIQWEWPQSTTSPSQKPVSSSADVPKYNTSDQSITTYAPGQSDATSLVPDQNSDYAYPNLWGYTALTGKNWGFFPGPYFDGEYSVNGNSLNLIDWTMPNSSSVNSPSFLIYNTKTLFTNPNGGAAAPPVLGKPTFVVSSAGISAQQDLDIASSADPFSRLSALANPQATNYDGTIAPTSPVSLTAKAPSGQSVVLDYYSPTFAADLASLMANTTYQAVGTSFTLEFSSTNNMPDATGVITIQSGSLSANNVTTVVQAANQISSKMTLAVSKGSSPAVISSYLASLTGLSATDANQKDVSKQAVITGWQKTDADTGPGPVSSGSDAITQAISDLSDPAIPAGTTFTITFSAPNGILNPSGASGQNTQSVQLMIIPGSISAANVQLTMAQAKALLANDPTGSALGSDLQRAQTSSGAAGANVQASIGGSAAVTTMTNASSLFDWLTTATTTNKKSTITQTTTMTFQTTQFGITTSSTLSVLPAGSMTLASAVVDPDFGSYSNLKQPSDWHHVPATATITVLDGRDTPVNWGLTLVDDLSGNLGSVAVLSAVSSSAVSSAGNELDPMSLDSGIVAQPDGSGGETGTGIPDGSGGNNSPLLVFRDQSPGGNGETVTVTVHLVLDFTQLPTKSIVTADSLVWSIQPLDKAGNLVASSDTGSSGSSGSSGDSGSVTVVGTPTQVNFAYTVTPPVISLYPVTMTIKYQDSDRQQVASDTSQTLIFAQVSVGGTLEKTLLWSGTGSSTAPSVDPNSFEVLSPGWTETTATTPAVFSPVTSPSAAYAFQELDNDSYRKIANPPAATCGDSDFTVIAIVESVPGGIYPTDARLAGDSPGPMSVLLVAFSLLLGPCLMVRKPTARTPGGGGRRLSAAAGSA